MVGKPVFNTRRRKLLRKHIPIAENLVSLGIVCALGGMVIWVLGQRSAYDPEHRDLPAELLAKGSPSIELYNRPLRPWVEPGSPQPSQHPQLGLFPETILDREWQLAGRVRKFVASNLYEKINGEAERFLKQGFQSMNYAVLRSGEDGTEIAMELYDQGDLGGSIGIFSEHVADDRIVQQQDDVIFFRTSAGVIGRKGRFFFRVAADRQSEGIVRKSGQLVQAFAELKDDARDAPEGLQVLTGGMGISEREVSFQSKNVFQLDFANDFWFGRLDGDEAARVFVHIAGTEADASELLGAILEEQSYDYLAITSDAAWTTLRHRFLATYFAIGRRGRFVFGVDNLSEESRIGEIMEKFSQSMRDE